MKILGALVLVVVALIAIRYGMQEGLSTVTTGITRDQAAACLSMTGSTTAVENGFTDIIGSIKNGCDRKFSQVTVSFKLAHGSSGSAAGDISGALYPGSKPDRTPRQPAFEMPDSVILAYASDIKPGETRKFKSSSHIPGNATFRFEKIAGF